MYTQNEMVKLGGQIQQYTVHVVQTPIPLREVGWREGERDREGGSMIMIMQD